MNIPVGPKGLWRGLLCAGFLLIAAEASAQTTTEWRGRDSDDFNTSGNWSLGIPASNVNALIATPSTVDLDTLGAGKTPGNFVDDLTLDSGATLNVDSQTLTIMGSTVDNAGAINLNAGADDAILSFGPAAPAQLKGGGTVTLSTNGAGEAVLQGGTDTGTLSNVDNTIQGAGSISVTNTDPKTSGFRNEAAGTVLANAPGQTLSVSASGGIENQGTFEVDTGSTLSAMSELSNFSGDTLTGGSYVVNGGTLQLDLGTNSGAEIVKNAASITLNGAGSSAATLVQIDKANVVSATTTGPTLFEDAAGNSALAALAENSTASSSLTIEGGYDFQTLGNFTNAGSVTVGSGSTLGITPQVLHGTEGYHQVGGTTTIDAGGELDAPAVDLGGGVLQVDGTVDPLAVSIASGAELDGTGTIDGDITSDGTLILGDGLGEPGTLTDASGDYTQQSDGTLIDGIGPSASGLLDLESGDAYLDGTLTIDLLDGFTPTYGQTFALMDFGQGFGFSGQFTGGFDPSLWSVLYTGSGPGQLDLEYLGAPASSVPEPSAWADLLFLAALAASAPLARRRFAA